MASKSCSVICAVVAGIYLFLYTPILVLIVFSFNNAPFPSSWMGFTLTWYRELFYSSALWASFFNSLVIALFSTVLSLLLSLGLIYYTIHEQPIEQFVYLFFSSVFIPEIIFALALLSFFSIFAVPLGLMSLIIGHTVLGLGYAVPIIFSSYLSLDKRLQEASFDLGATKGQTFYKITLPLLKPALFVAGLLVFIISFDDFIVSYFCAGGEAQTLSLYIYSMIRSGISPVINALSTLLLVFTSLLVLLFCSVMLRWRLW
jgi:spermidine/putrescine transport system permease protein